jgi:hypothetical protein
MPNYIVYSALVLLAGHSALATAAQADDAVRQLVESTSVASILKIDSEQAALVIEQLPEDLPADLRSDLRRAVDQNLRYDEMEAALIASIGHDIDPSALDRNLRWWASGPGREITKAEAGIYASLFAGSTFNAFNPVTEIAQSADSSAVEDVVASGNFDKFVSDLLTYSAPARSCLLLTVDVNSDCPQRDTDEQSASAAVFSQRIAGLARERYSQLSSGDLHAYIAYLNSEGARATLQILRSALAEIEAQNWNNAVKQASSIIDRYARSNFGAAKDEALRQTIADLDQGRNLTRAHLTLSLMRRAGTSDPAVLLQLARVTLMQAQNLTDRDFPPSVPRLDADSLRIAQYWVDQALQSDAHRADALLMDGHVAYLKFDFKRSVELLEQAKTAGCDSPWWRINMGDALWALGTIPAPNNALAQRAAEQFEAALKTRLPEGAKQRAVHQLGAIYAALGNVQKADGFQREYISEQQGIGKAYALDRYALFLLFDAHDIDAAVAAERQAAKISDYPDGRSLRVTTLAVRGGTLYASGHARQAAPYIAEARQIEPDLESVCPDLARFPATLPGVFGIHAAGLLRDFSGSMGGQTLVRASVYATGGEIEDLLAWGANPNYFDAEDGTPLHVAILAHNLPAVRVLLAHGANPLTPSVDGQTPSQLADQASDPQLAEIKLLVASAVASRPFAAAPIGSPLKVGYRYRLRKAVVEERWGYSFKAGEELTFLRDCQYTDASLACFFFRDERFPTSGRDMALPKDQLSSWTDWFEELGPDAAPKAQQ